MNVRLPLLLLLACICLSGLGFTYLLITQAEAQRKKLAQRLSKALKRHGEAAEEFTAPMRLAIPEVKRSLLARFAGLLGADLDRRDLYPIAWWLVPVIALVPARLIALLAEFLVGPTGIMLTAPACWLISVKYFQSRHARHVTILFQQFPDALAMIVRAVRVGIPLTEAIRAVAREAAEPTAGEFARLSDEISIGTQLD